MVNTDLSDLSQHIAITSTDQVSKIAAPLADNFGIQYFRYLKLYNDGSRILLSNHADCTRFFYELGHHKELWFDGEFPTYLVKGWHTWDVMRVVHYGGEVSSLEKEINKLLNLYYGLTFVTKGLDHFEIYTFDSNSPNIYLIDKKLLEHFIIYFKDQARKLIDYAEHEKLIIQLKEPILDNDISNKNKILAAIENMHINRYYLGGQYEGTYLTAKEVKCIYWLIQGKSADEIATIEGNTRKTVEYHLENARKKLNCYKQAQLAKLIVEAGLLTFYEA
jgi:DNA-binding CsgD family transcriptional regulator